MKKPAFSLWLSLLFLVWLPPQTSWGETVIERLPDGVSVAADYRPGVADKPAILVLHGFLTTNGFNTVQVMVNELADAGHTVLAPTLSLGISNRNTSLPCDAIHTHTMQMDLAEIDFWTRWLASKGARNIILLGHSSGSLQLAIYVADQPHPAVSKLIATSLINVQQYGTAQGMEKDIRVAEQLLAQASPPLQSYHLVYCNNYTATPQAYLSYIRWSSAEVLTTIKQRKVPIYAIMGGKDNRFGPSWVEALRTAGIEVKVIAEANHFFDAAQEFDLLDEVKNCIVAKPRR